MTEPKVMDETGGKIILSQLRKKWIRKALLSQFFIVLAVTLFVSTLLYKLFFLPFYWSMSCSIVLFLVIAIINPVHKLSEGDVAKYLNITQPSLEESTHLVLRSEASLNLLEKLQVKKIEYRLTSIHLAPPFKKQFATSLIVLLITLAGTAVLFIIPFNAHFSNPPLIPKHISSVNSIPEIVLPGIKNAIISIVPPAYTGKDSRQQSTFNVLAEEDALLSWQIQTNAPAKEMELIFNDRKTLQLSGNADKYSWKAKILIRTSGLYQVKIGNKLSEFYKIETIKDQPPAIAVQSPKPNTLINYGIPERVMINATLADDYGISSANISATISHGQGEAVKFKEQKLLFENFAAGYKTAHLQKLIDCKKMGMIPGDELYFFITATDNHNQQTRSDVYIITLQDTASLISMDGMAMGIDIRPQLFRSERQIIIETEQLVKNKTTISLEEFRKKSNDLGIDQKLLRLRYSKFLGEETNTEIAGEDDSSEQYSNKDNTAEIIKKYGHEHDNAEDANFFDTLTKKQLEATLAEMWKAELKLKTFIPKEALPFEYSALRLLKDLQQKSRVYVQKTGSKIMSLKPGNRLTGDLSKITQPVTAENSAKPDSATTLIKRALNVLELLKNNDRLKASSKDILRQAFRQLSITVADKPAFYLTSLTALGKIISENYTAKDIENAEVGLQKVTPVAERLPSANSSAAMNLSKQYFIKLNKAGKQ